MSREADFLVPSNFGRLKRLSIPRRRPVSEAIVPICNPGPNPSRASSPGSPRERQLPVHTTDICIPDTPPSRGSTASPFSPVLALTPLAPSQACSGSAKTYAAGSRTLADRIGTQGGAIHPDSGALHSGATGTSHDQSRGGGHSRASMPQGGLHLDTQALLRVPDQATTSGSGVSFRPVQPRTSRHFQPVHLAEPHVTGHQPAGAGPGCGVSEPKQQPAGVNRGRDPGDTSQQVRQRNLGEATVPSQHARNVAGPYSSNARAESSAANMAGPEQTSQGPGECGFGEAGCPAGSDARAGAASHCAEVVEMVGGVSSSVLGWKPASGTRESEGGITAWSAGPTLADSRTAVLKTRPLGGAGLFKGRRCALSSRRIVKGWIRIRG
jgi:hypothetical protein